MLFQTFDHKCLETILEVRSVIRVSSRLKFNVEMPSSIKVLNIESNKFCGAILIQRSVFLHLCTLLTRIGRVKVKVDRRAFATSSQHVAVQAQRQEVSRQSSINDRSDQVQDLLHWCVFARRSKNTPHWVDETVLVASIPRHRVNHMD